MTKEEILTRISLIAGIISGISAILSLEKPIIAIILVVLSALLIIYFFYKSKNNDNPQSLVDFKVLKQDIFLDIRDGTGEIVQYRTVLKMSALRDGVNLYPHILYCSDGIISDITSPTHRDCETFYDEGEYKVRISMSQPLKKNENVEITLEAIYNGSFTAQNEYWMIRSFTNMEQISVFISFPDNKLPLSTNCLKKIAGKYINSKYQPVLTYKNASATPNSLIKLDIKNVIMYETYKLMWRW